MPFSIIPDVRDKNGSVVADTRYIRISYKRSQLAARTELLLISVDTVVGFRLLYFGTNGTAHYNGLV